MISSLGSQSSMLVNRLSPKSDTINDKKIEKTEVVENNRVSLLAKQIENGTYRVDATKTANAIAEELS